MGKSKPEIILDSDVYQKFIGNSGDKSIGVLIGTVSEQSDFIVAHVADTLEEPENDTSGDDDEVNQVERKKMDMDSVPLNTLAFHAKQVMPLLPGGLSILGLFVVDSRDSLFTFNTETRVKSLLTSVTKGIGKATGWYGAGREDFKEKLFIHYNPGSKKFVAKIFDTSSFKAKAADVISQPLAWSKLESHFDTVGVMHVPKQDASAPLKRNLQSLMKSFEDSLNNAKILINGSFPSADRVYSEISVGPEIENSVEDLECEEYSCEDSLEEAGGSGDGPSEAQPSPVHILFDREPGTLRCETPVASSSSRSSSPGPGRQGLEDEFINHLHVQGKIAVIAFVPEGSSTALMAKRVKEDIIRSLSSRIVMHCESLIDEESTTEPVHNVLVHHEIPRRVFVQIPNSSLYVSDYLFPGDGPKDCLLSFRDILSIKIDDEDSILIDREQPYTNDMNIRGSVEELLSQADTDMKLAVEGFTSRKLLVGLAFLLIAFLTITLALPHILRLLSSSSSSPSSHQATGKSSKEL